MGVDFSCEIEYFKTFCTFASLVRFSNKKRAAVMINKIRIRNFKSIVDLTLDLGRVNVIIGANGCGKTNILEAITFASMAGQDKLLSLIHIYSFVCIGRP